LPRHSHRLSHHVSYSICLITISWNHFTKPPFSQPQSQLLYMFASWLDGTTASVTVRSAITFTPTYIRCIAIYWLFPSYTYHRTTFHHTPILASLSQSTETNMSSRPAKKRCQYKVIYNIPTLPKEGDKPTDGSPPAMTANPTQCPSAAVRIAGDCPHCQKVFCSGHRTPESHHWYVLPLFCVHVTNLTQRWYSSLS
jgi:hypothetical protein